MDAYTTGLRHHPDDAELLARRGGTQVNRGQQYRITEPGGGPWLLAGVADLDAALAIDPEHSLALRFRAIGRGSYASWVVNNVGDPGPWFEKIRQPVMVAVEPSTVIPPPPSLVTP